MEFHKLHPDEYASLPFNLIATKEPFFSDCISGDVSALARISITYMTWVCRQLIN